MDKASKIDLINNEAREITKNMDGVKISSTYLISTELYKIETHKLIKLVTEKFLEHPATIMALIGNTDNLLMHKKMPHWKIPSPNLPLKDLINREIDEYLDLFFLKLESRKSGFLETSKAYNFTKIIFTPLIEGNGMDISLYFISLTIYSNGSILIELFENLKNVEYNSDFYHPFSFMEYKLFPDFNRANRVYSKNPNGQLNDMRQYIIDQLTIINNKNQFNELSFFTHFITNMDSMNKLPQFKKHRLYTWLVNAPYRHESFINGLTLEGSSKYLRTEPHNHESISYISKGTNYIVWNKETDGSTKNDLFLEQASFFLSAATPFFQNTALEETIVYSLEKFQIRDNKKLLEFNEWAHRYRKTFLHIYRVPNMALTDLFIELKANSDFKNYTFINEIKDEEMKLIQEKNLYRENKRYKNVELIIYIISALSILQVADIFTNNLIYIGSIGILILLLLFFQYFRGRI